MRALHSEQHGTLYRSYLTSAPFGKVTTFACSCIHVRIQSGITCSSLKGADPGERPHRKQQSPRQISLTKRSRLKKTTRPSSSTTVPSGNLTNTFTVVRATSDPSADSMRRSRAPDPHYGTAAHSPRILDSARRAQQHSRIGPARPRRRSSRSGGSPSRASFTKAAMSRDERSDHPADREDDREREEPDDDAPGAAPRLRRRRLLLGP